MSGPICPECGKLATCGCEETPSSPGCETCDDTGLVDLCDEENGPAAPVLCPDCVSTQRDDQLVTGGTIVVRFMLTPEEIGNLDDAGQRHLDKIVHDAIEILRETATTHVNALVDPKLATIPAIDVERVDD